jgi:16S rRNA (cytosine967-C5)-methyltransferase
MIRAPGAGAEDLTTTEKTAGLSVRMIAARRLAQVLDGAPFSPIDAKALPEGRDRALANRMVTTALRRHGHIEHALSKTLSKGMPKRAGLLAPILKIAVAQLLYMDDVPAHSALHLAVEAARTDRHARRFDKLVNGVLRQIQREKADYAALPAAMLFPQWAQKSWAGTYGAGLEAFGAALLDTPPLDLTLKAPDNALVSALGATPVLGNTVRLATRDAAVNQLPGYDAGAWWVQDAAAAIPARLAQVVPDQRALDICAAPGGKTAQLIAMGAKVTALDLDADRMGRLKDNLARLGMDAECVVADALEYEAPAPFDVVLLDAPCSATGTFRRHPEVLWQRDAQGVADRAKLQQRLIGRAAGMLRPGGTLIYCVCSLQKEEGEDQLAYVAKAHPELALVPVTAEELEGWTAPLRADGSVRLHPGLAVPGAAQGTLDGFFIARFEKR